jgi:hypothetical protein
MFPPTFPTTFDEYNTGLTRAKSMRDPDQLFRDDVLQPDPVYMTIRKGVTALLGLFTQSQQTVPVTTDASPVEQNTCIVPFANDEDTPRIAA